MGFKCGIIGLPNVGKSSLFNYLSKTQMAKVGNFSFCTINPNITDVKVEDLRVDKLSEISKSLKKTYATLKIVDIAGLVEGASKGEGMGNLFLENICSVDLIIQMIRCFDDSDVESVLGQLDPLLEIQIIRQELIEYDLKRLETTKSIKDPNLKSLIKDKILQGKPYENLDWQLLSQKQTILLCNGNNAEIIRKVKEAYPNFDVLQINLKCLKQEDLNNIVKLGYEKLNLISYFTTGIEETRAWTIEKNTKAPQAAAKIHSDFEKKFIKAEATSYEQYIKNPKKNNIVGKEYIVQDGDVLLFKINR